MAVRTSSHKLCFEQIYEIYQNFYLKSFQFLVVKFSVYLNRPVFIMRFAGRSGGLLFAYARKALFFSLRVSDK